MIYALGRADSAYRMMNIANTQMSMIRNMSPNMDMKSLHQLDKQLSLNMAKEQFNYKMLDRLDKMNKKIVEQKFKR